MAVTLESSLILSSSRYVNEQFLSAQPWDIWDDKPDKHSTDCFPFWISSQWFFFFPNEDEEKILIVYLCCLAIHRTTRFLRSWFDLWSFKINCNFISTHVRVEAIIWKWEKLDNIATKWNKVRGVKCRSGRSYWFAIGWCTLFTVISYVLNIEHQFA